MPTLRIRVAGQTFEAPLPETAVKVGSAAPCDLTLACEGVASEHCLLEPMAGGQWRLKDLASGHATRLNGTEVRQVSLKPGDVIEVGAALIVFAPELAPAEPAPAAPRPAAAVRPAPPAPRAVVAAAPVAPAATASAAAPPGAPEVAAPSASATPAAPARTAPEPAVSATARAASGGRRLLLPALLLAGVGVALAFFGLIGTGGGGGIPEARLRSDLEAAIQRYRDRDVLGARADLAALIERARAGDVARQAATWLESANQAIATAEAALARWSGQALEFDLAAAPSRRAVFLEEHGAGFAARVDQVLGELAAKQQAWRRSESERVGIEVGALLDEGRYHDARARWSKAGQTAPAGVNFAAEVRAGHEAVDQAAEQGATALLERVELAVTHRGAAAGLELLSTVLARYEGTGVHGRLAERLAALEALAREQRAATPAVGPAAPATPGPGSSPPVGPGPSAAPSAPTGPAEAQALLAQAQAEAAQAVAQRAFARAVDRIDAALAGVTDAAVKQALTDRRADLALARNGLDTLAGDLTATPAKYGRLEMGERLYASPVSADRDGISVAVAGGSTRLLWARMAPDLFAVLAERMQASAQDALPMAALLHEVGAGVACEKMLVRAGEGGADRSMLFGMLARWRGEAVPEGGYVPYEERYVSPAQREELILASRIRGGLDRLAQARDAATRRSAVDELLALGPTALSPLTKALTDRRAALVSEIAGRKVWTAGRTRQRLYDLLEKRRAFALALIEDEAAYPYPNPNHQNQAEVERRVDEVREVWERPFRLVAGFDDEVKDALEGLTEIDEALARVVPGYKPDLASLEDLASRAVDMPSYAPGSASGQREYALKVLAYNERVATSATREERDNVRAVNEYRIMMGRIPVKIEERLVRAARGHSRHMQQHDYFAHVNPQYPELKDPGTRARRQGYGGSVGENIAWGTVTGRDAFRAWFGSSGHHRNMLGRGWTEMGAGRSVPHHWTQLFGALGGKSLGDPPALPAPAADVAPDPEGAAPTAPGAPLVPRLPDEKPPGQPPGLPDPGDAPPGDGTPR